MDGFRIGRVSAVNYEAGTARILYKDKSEEVTKELPFLSFEYFMPEVDDMVLVCHLPNGMEAAVILGRFWSEKNMPPEGKRGLYRKDMSRTPGKAMMRYDETTGQMETAAPNMKMKTNVLNMETDSVDGSGKSVGFTGNRVRMEGTASITITGGNTTINGSTVEISGGTVSITGGTIEISGSGDVILDGISLKNHTHICNAVGSESSKAN